MPAPGPDPRRPDYECGPADVMVGFAADRSLVAAVATRALIEGASNSLIWRRWARLGARAEGVDPYNTTTTD